MGIYFFPPSEMSTLWLWMPRVVPPTSWTILWYWWPVFCLEPKSALQALVEEHFKELLSLIYSLIQPFLLVNNLVCLFVSSLSRISTPRWPCTVSWSFPLGTSRSVVHLYVLKCKGLEPKVARLPTRPTKSSQPSPGRKSFHFFHYSCYKAHTFGLLKFHPYHKREGKSLDCSTKWHICCSLKALFNFLLQPLVCKGRTESR